VVVGGKGRLTERVKHWYIRYSTAHIRAAAVILLITVGAPTKIAPRFRMVGSSMLYGTVSMVRCHGQARQGLLRYSRMIGPSIPTIEDSLYSLTAGIVNAISSPTESATRCESARTRRGAIEKENEKSGCLLPFTMTWQAGPRSRTFQSGDNERAVYRGWDRHYPNPMIISWDCRSGTPSASCKERFFSAYARQGFPPPSAHEGLPGRAASSCSRLHNFFTEAGHSLVCASLHQSCALGL
jgi:hypothetical protein